MLREEIISKGVYTYPQVPGFVSVKQYIMLRKQGKKHLLLRFENHRMDAVSALSFSVKQYDAKGTLIHQERIDLPKINCAGKSVFIYDRAVKIKERCADFRVTVHSASYGEYVYEAHGDSVRVLYQKEKPGEKVDSNVYRRKMGGENHHVAPRTLNEPKPLFLFACIALVLMAILVGVQLYHFTRTEVIFTLDEIEYAFETPNHKDGPIRITGYKGRAGNLVIPEEIEGHKITRIDKGALQRASLRSVVIKGSVIVEDKAFADNRYMQTVTLEKASRVGDYAFSGCYSLEQVDLGKNLTQLGTGAFNGCLSITEISLPATLQSIGDNAFERCSSLTSLEIPANVDYIGADILKGCESLTSLSVPFIGETEEDQQRLKYFFDAAPKSLENLTVTRLDEVYYGMFSGANTLRSIVFTQKITEIGSYAFENCSNLESFEIPEDLDEIGNAAFQNCRRLKTVKLPKELLVLPQNVFSGCYNLEELLLPEGLEVIEAGAFHSCRSLKTVVLPTSLKRIEAGVFAGCHSLSAMTLPFLGSDPDTPSAMSFYFDGASESLGTVVLQTGAALPDDCFLNFTALKSVTLPEEMTQIGSRAFFGCLSLVEVYIPNSVTSIKVEAFYNCASLETVRLPSQLTVLEEGVFQGCSALKSVNIPDSVSTLGNNSFRSCTSLVQVDLPNTLSAIGDSAFHGCTSLKSLVLPSRITELKPETFADCFALEDITFPGLLTTIWDSAFRNCTSLKNVSLPNSLSTIRPAAFEGCTALETFTVPTYVERIGSGLLHNCTSLRELTIPYVGASLEDDSSKLSYLFASNSNTVNAVPSSLRKLTITSDTHLVDEMFYNVKGLEEVVLPDGVTIIPHGAFYGCSSLRTVTLPQSVLTLKESAFRDCVRLNQIELHEGLTTIEDNVFAGCTALSRVSIPKSVTSLGSSVFNNCTSIVELTLPHLYGQTLSGFFEGTVPQSLKKVTLTDETVIAANSFAVAEYLEEVVLEGAVTVIQSSAFESCSKLSRITLPDTLTEIQDNAFLGCSALESITLPANVKNIGTQTFANCTKLSTVTLSNSLETIGERAFASCEALCELTVPNSVRTIGQNAFDGCTALEELTLPFVGSGRLSNGTLNELFGYTVPVSLKKLTLTDMETLPSGALSNCQYLEEIVLPERLVTIESYALRGCERLKSLTIPESVTSIGWYAFDGCNRLYLINNLSSYDLVGDTNETRARDYALKICQNGETATTVLQNGYLFLLGGDSEWYLIDYQGDLTELSLPASFPNPNEVGGSITGYHVPSYLFFHDRVITGLYISNAVESIGEYAFYDCNQLVDLTFSSSSSLTEIPRYCFAYSPVTKVVLPGQIQTIRYGAFTNCAELTSVTIPASVTSIENYAFGRCEALEEVYNLSSLEIRLGGSDHGYVAYYALIVHSSSSAEALHQVTVNGLIFKKSDSFWLLVGYEDVPQDLTLSSFTYQGQTVSSYRIKREAFSYSNIKTLVIGKEVTEIGEGAFAYCYNLTSVIFEEGSVLEELGSRMFYNCSGLRSVVLPQEITKIGSYAFCNAGLESLTVPNRVREIGSYAFTYCYNLKTVTISQDSNLERIGSYAFTGNSSLTEILLPNKLMNVGEDAFLDCVLMTEVYNLSNLHVTAGSTGVGQVAYYAIAVYNTATPRRETQTLTLNGCTVDFLRYNNVWYLCSIDFNGSYNSTLYLPNLGENDAIRSYVLTRRAIEEHSCSAIMIPTDVSAIAVAALEKLNYQYGTIFYEGTEAQWSALIGNNAPGGFVSYYAACVHQDENTWTFDSNGKVSTEASPCRTTVIREANCTTPGEADIKCLGCNRIWKQVLPTNNVHDFDANNTCTRCNSVKILVTAQNFESLSCITNYEKAPFTITDQNVIVSSPDLFNSYSDLIIRADVPTEISFTLKIASQGDSWQIRRNRVIEYSMLEETEHVFTYTLEAGESLTLRFRRRSNDSTPLQGTIENLQLIQLNGQTS